jgi:hypothetical protein
MKQRALFHYEMILEQNDVTRVSTVGRHAGYEYERRDIANLSGSVSRQR